MILLQNVLVETKMYISSSLKYLYKVYSMKAVEK